MLTSELKTFFNEYADAYLKFDATTLVNFFHFPCLIHDISGIHFLNTEQDLKSYEKNFLNDLQQRHVTKIESELFDHDFSNNLSNAVGCKLAYQLFDVNNNLIMDFDYSYSLVKEGRWKILFARIGTIRKA